MIHKSKRVAVLLPSPSSNPAKIPTNRIHPNQFISSSIAPHQASSMAASFTNFLTKIPSPPLLPKPTLSQFQFPFHLPTKSPDPARPANRARVVLRAAPPPSSPGPATTPPKPKDERVQKVHSIEEFDAALRAAKDRLVVVEYATSKSDQSKKIYPFMVELSRTCSDVDFILVMGDESESTRSLCRREKVEEVPHFTFYKSMEKIHEEEAIGPDVLAGDVLYYGDSHSEVVQLHSGDDVKRLIEEHRVDSKLIVLDVGLKHCGPCVKVYPTVVKLSKQMETVVFARMNGDENESCMDFLREMEVIQVPTFLFIRDGEIRGRYVGSGKGELIGEILRYQGVRVTY